MTKIITKTIGTITVQGAEKDIEKFIESLQLPKHYCDDYGRCNCQKGKCDKGLSN